MRALTRRPRLAASTRWPALAPALALALGCGARSELFVFDHRHHSSSASGASGGGSEGVAAGAGKAGASGAGANGGAGEAGQSGDAGQAGAPSDACGDDRLTALEQCDDGNTRNGDGCSGACRFEPIAVSAGLDFSCAIGGNGALKCWGLNYDEGELGLGDALNRGDQPGQMGDNLPAVDLGSDHRVLALSVGTASTHSCAILDDGRLKCWGGNAWGQLGLGDTRARGLLPDDMGANLPAIELGNGRSARAVTTGRFSTCVLLDNGAVKCWGGNFFGQLGQGDTTQRGQLPNQVGNPLPAISLGTGRRAVAIASGEHHSCALLDDGAVKCWGSNSMGQLGLGDTTNRGDQAGQMGNALPAVELGTGRTALAISAGGATSCALLDGGDVKCWGDNGMGQLGLGDTLPRGQNPAEMGDNLAAVALGAGRSALGVRTSGNDTCALLDDHSVKCWGYNAGGELGLGDERRRGDSPGQMGDQLPTVDFGNGRSVRSLSVGYPNSCALLDDGTVKCWGANRNGWLGLGDSVHHGAGPGEMGDALPPVDLTF